MNKKIISLVIALILMFSVATISFAKPLEEEPSTYSQEEMDALKEQLKDANEQISQLQTTKPQSLSPNVLIQSYDFGGSSVDGAKNFKLNYTLKNTSSNLTIQNVIVKVDGGESFKIANGSNSSYINSIAPNGTVSQSVELASGLNVESGVYSVGISVTFEYFDNGEKGNGTSELTVSIPVSQKDKFSFNEIQMADTAYVDKEQNVSFKLVNTGYTTLKNCTISVLDSKGNVLTSAFYGAVEPSSQIDDGGKLAITPDAEGEIKYTLKIEYEDKYANAKENSKDFMVNVKVYENPFEKEDVVNNNNKTEEKSFNPLFIAIPAVVVLAVIAVVVIVVVKKKKNNNEEDFEDENI